MAAKDLLQVVKTKKTELLFLALFLRLLKPGGRAAVIVPDGVLFGSTKAHKELRRMLVDDHQAEHVHDLVHVIEHGRAAVEAKVQVGQEACIDQVPVDIAGDCSIDIALMAR